MKMIFVIIFLAVFCTGCATGFNPIVTPPQSVPYGQAPHASLPVDPNRGQYLHDESGCYAMFPAQDPETKDRRKDCMKNNKGRYKTLTKGQATYVKLDQSYQKLNQKGLDADLKRRERAAKATIRNLDKLARIVERFRD